MKFSSNSIILQKAINLTEKAISTRTALPILENLYLNLQNGKLKLRGNDLELGIEYEIPVENEEIAGSILVKASTLSSIVSKMNNQLLTIDVNENNRLSIKSEHVSFDVVGLPTTDYPVFPEIEEGTKLTLKVEQLSKLIKHTIFAVSTDETKQFLNGILIKTEETSISFVATDGFRLALKKETLDQPVVDMSIIVPHKTMTELYKILQQLNNDADIIINITENKISFKMDDLVLISRLIQGQFPAYNQVLPKQSKNSFTLNTDDLINASERASIIATHSNNVVKLIFTNNIATIRAKASKTGEFKEDMDLTRTAGEDTVKIAFNVKLLQDALKNMETEKVSIQFNNELSPCVVCPVLSDDYIYIIMPIRTSDYDDTAQAETVDKEEVSVSV